MIRIRHVPHTGDTMRAHKILVRKTQGKIPVCEPRRQHKDISKVTKPRSMKSVRHVA